MTDLAPVSRGTLVAAIAVLSAHAPTSPALAELQAAYRTLPDQTPTTEGASS